MLPLLYSGTLLAGVLFTHPTFYIQPSQWSWLDAHFWDYVPGILQWAIAVGWTREIRGKGGGGGGGRGGEGRGGGVCRRPRLVRP